MFDYKSSLISIPREGVISDHDQFVKTVTVNLNMIHGKERHIFKSTNFHELLKLINDHSSFL